MQEQKKYNLADGNIRKRFVTYKQAAGATYKMENKVLINTDIFEMYLEQFRT